MKSLWFSMALVLFSCGAQATNQPPPVQSGLQQSSPLFGDTVRGKELVHRWCVTCHSLGPTANDQVPSFPSMAENLNQVETTIRAFLIRPHAPMPPLELTAQQIEDVVAFLKGLDAGPGAAP